VPCYLRCGLRTAENGVSMTLLSVYGHSALNGLSTYSGLHPPNLELRKKIIE